MNAVALERRSESENSLRSPEKSQVCRTAAQQALQTSNYRQLRHVQCAGVGGVLLLLGRVESYYLKQLAQTIVRKVAGDLRIENHINVDLI